MIICGYMQKFNGLSRLEQRSANNIGVERAVGCTEFLNFDISVRADRNH